MFAINRDVAVLVKIVNCKKFLFFCYCPSIAWHMFHQGPANFANVGVLAVTGSIQRITFVVYAAASPTYSILGGPYICSAGGLSTGQPFPVFQTQGLYNFYCLALISMCYQITTILPVHLYFSLSIYLPQLFQSFSNIIHSYFSLSNIHAMNFDLRQACKLALVVLFCFCVVDCCVNRLCWCFTTKGLCTVGQDEIVILLECLPDEKTVPVDILRHLHVIYEMASHGWADCYL